ncbi:MAG: acetyl-CoA carboxylase biotin carboxyl carrier protein [Planctomycetota bacterium]
MSLEDVERCIKLLREHDLNELVVKTEGFEFRARRGFPPAAVIAGAAAAPAASVHTPGLTGVSAAGVAVQSQPNFKPAGSAAEKTIPPGCTAVRSPIVGTYYRRPSPDKEYFIEVGDEVSADTVIGLVEALKVYNEIKADVSGTVVDILVDDVTPVEFDTPLVVIRTHG